MTFEDSFWNTDSVFNFYEAENPERELIQPIVAKLVDDLCPERLLDFGCGDAYIERLLDAKIQVDLYDKNIRSLEREHQLLNRPTCRIIRSKNDIPSDYYDCVLLSFVLVCVDTKEEQKKIFRSISKALKKSGTLLLVGSHPCFLQYDFAAFRTSFEKDAFPYLTEAVPYTVWINQPDGKPPISFVDYHWTLSFWVNRAIECGFDLAELIEIPDGDYKNLNRNKNYPPFLIMKFLQAGD